jgi:acetyltransferase-like isoleucine patch superfamily enzyme
LSDRVVRRLRQRARRALGIDEPPPPPSVLTMGRLSHHRPTVHHYPGDRAGVRIGNFSSIGDGVEFLPGGNHRTDWVSTFALRYKLGVAAAPRPGQVMPSDDTIVGHDVWIGRGAKVLGGVTIGHGAVVGAYSLVTKDVRPYAIVVGTPAQEVRRRFDDAVVDALLRIAWWDWPDDDLVAELDLIESDRVEAFVARHDPDLRQ